MSRPLRLPRPTTPLHVYRHLLRESSYLPPFARPFVDDRIKERFRLHLHNGDHQARIRQANRSLRQLRAANAGDLDRMRRVLYLCFGRLGQRRRKLMNDLLEPEVPSDFAELEKYAEIALTNSSRTRKRDWLDKWDLKKVRAFAMSQAGAGLETNPRANIQKKQLDLDNRIPKENIWGRRPALKLTRTREKKAWKNIAKRLLPPLPKNEWEMLRDLASGKAIDPAWVNPTRRPVAKSLSGEVDERQTWNWRAYAAKPVRIVDHQANRRNKLLSGAVDDNTPTGDPQPIGCHHYTRRSWRRLVGGIWQLSAVMEKRPVDESWNVVWGKPETRAVPVVDAATTQLIENSSPR